MPVFDKIELVPKAVNLTQPHPGTIGSTPITDINQPLFNSGVPDLEDDGIYPILPFDIPFSLTKPASSPSAQTELFTYPRITTKIPPYSAIEIYGHIISSTPPFNSSAIFESRTLLNPQPPSGAPLAAGSKQFIIKAGNVLVDNSSGVVVTTTSAEVNYNFLIAISNIAGFYQSWLIKGIARFI